MHDIITGPIDHYLQALWENKASDLLLVAGAPATIRVDGLLQPMDATTTLSPEGIARLLAAVLPIELAERLVTAREIDFSFGWEDRARFRGHAFHQRGSLGLTLRMIPWPVPSFAEIGVPPSVEAMADAPQGLVLVTGPTGSGKSSTLAAMIHHVSTQRACHIVTIEDPIEHFHSHARSIVSQREIGTDSSSFPNALRAVLREDPDVVLVGEMRDLESIETTLTIAETGHLVLATLHTNDAPQAIDRVVDVFPSDRQAQIRSQLEATLLGVVAQRLVPRIGGGRVAAFEVLLATTAVRSLVREGKTEQLRNIMATGQRAGMKTLVAALESLVEAGVISPETALNAL